MDLKHGLLQQGTSSRSPSNSILHTEAANNSSCSNSPNPPPTPTPTPTSASVSLPPGLRRLSPDDELHPDTRLLKLARLHDPPSPHSTLESHALHLTHNSNSFSYLSQKNYISNHASPTSSYHNSSTTSSTNQVFNIGAAPFSSSSSSSFSPASHSKLFHYANLEDTRHNYPLMQLSNSAAASSLAARTHHPSLPCFNPGPPTSLFTQEQLLEFTQQTYVFKHFAAGVTPPTALLLPIINSVAALSRSMGAGSLHFGSNAGMFGVGGLRGNVDLEPGRCRRTDGKKWRCAREVVPDQKYCERHMHRGRHRARAKLNAAVSNITDPLNPSLSPSHIAARQSGGTNNVNVSNSSTSNVMSKEPQLHFSLQSGSAEANRSMQARNLAGQPEVSPNLAGLLKGSSAFPFFSASSCQTSARDADNLALRQFVAADWPRITRIDQPPPTLSWFDQLAEEQNKRSRFNTELSIAPTPSPLTLSAKFGGAGADQEDISHYMGLSMAVGAKTSNGAATGNKEDIDRYSGMRSWVPIAWDSPAIGGPLGEVLQSNTANSSGNNYSVVNNGGDGCLNLIEESWDPEENISGSAKESHSHSPSLTSPTGVLQIKGSFGSYSDSSSSASSPRPALKLESVNLGI